MFTLFCCFWISCAPLGYVLYRWTHVAMGCRWTRNERLYAIVFAIVCGPLTPVVTAVGILLHKLLTSDWGNQEAKW